MRVSLHSSRRFSTKRQWDPHLWREQLDRLLSNMFPNVSAWPVMVSNLHSGSWEKTALQMIYRVKDHRAKKRCQELLQNASKTLGPTSGVLRLAR